MITELMQAIGLAKGALDVVRGAKDCLPESPEKKAATVSLDQAERALQIAEASAAKELGYHLCQCSWPPQIMLRVAPNTFRCRGCGYEEVPTYVALI